MPGLCSANACLACFVAAPARAQDFERWTSTDAAEPLTAAELRSKCGNTLECAARIMGDKTLQLFARMICCVARPVRDEHLQAIEAFTSQKGAAAFNAGRANGYWVSTVRAIAGVLRDADVIRGCGVQEASPLLRMRPGASQAMAQTLFKLVVHAVAQRSWSMSYHSTCLPDAAFGLLAVTAGPAKRCAAYLKHVFQAIWAAEQLVAQGATPPPAGQAGQVDSQHAEAAASAPLATIKACLDDVAWNSLQICREILAAARDSSWDYSNERLRAFIWDLSATECNTKRVNEDVFKSLREAETENENKRVSHRRMHYLAGAPERSRLKRWLGHCVRESLVGL